MESSSLSPMDIQGLTDVLCATYEILSNRSRHDFLFGYCFYFACILKKLIPECQVCTLEDHYFIYYNNHYIDFRGMITREENLLDIYGYGSKKANLNNLMTIDDLEYEKNYAEHIGLTDEIRDKEFQKYEKELLETGTSYLSNLQSVQKRNRTLR